MNPLTQSKKTTILPLLIPLLLACFALLPRAQAVLPPPDGGYPNGNTAEGDDALFSLTPTANTGLTNTAIGAQALYSLTGGGGLYTASNNTATGFAALFSTTTGSFNTAAGWEALYSNITGNSNTANGSGALTRNTTGVGNTANGAQALANSNGDSNTATGAYALWINGNGTFNTATGYQALAGNNNGIENTATGAYALGGSGNDNTAIGFVALAGNTTGVENTAAGARALANNHGSDNTAIGFLALGNDTTGSNNTACGESALAHNRLGNNNIGLGNQAGLNLTNGSNNIEIGNPGVSGESNKIRIGKRGTQNGTFIAGIYGATAASGVGVIVSSNGQLGTVQSSARFKDDIKPMGKSSTAVLALNPVTFRYKHEIDPKGISQFGLVAEDVEKVSPDLVVRDEEGKVMSVRYEAVNAMLLNEFLKEHRKVEEQEATIAQLRKDFQFKLADQQRQIKALTSGLEKVNYRLEPNKPASQVVVNDR